MTQTYGPVAKALHWIAFGVLAAQYLVGFVMPHIGRDTLKEGWVLWHLILGIAVLFLFLGRYVWRLMHPVAPLPMAPWQTRLAHVTHISLYVLVIVNGILGWAAAGFRGWDVSLLEVIPLPALAHKGDAWAHQAGEIHLTLVYVLLALIGLHVLGALYHYFVVRDGVLQRMLARSSPE